MTVTNAPLLRVAIVGGGPGGLATAIALSKIPNIDVKLYEQASALREVGAGINIGTNSWNVLDLLGVADSLTTGHPEWTVLNINGRSGEELHRRERTPDPLKRPTIRTQRTALQSTLLAHVPPGTIQLSKKLAKLTAPPPKPTSSSAPTASAPWYATPHGPPDYDIAFTGTTIWRTLLPADAVRDLDARFQLTGWWHSPTTHVYFSPVGEGLWEIAARAYHDPATHHASKVSWGVPVTNAHVEAHFGDMLPDIREALRRVPEGGWREFAAFAGPELSQLTAWDNRVVLVGDASHALSGAFGSGAGFAMEDGWILAQALEHYGNDLSLALPLFDRIRLPYYSRMYAHLARQAALRAMKLKEIGAEKPSYDDRVRTKIITDGARICLGSICITLVRFGPTCWSS
ncbi:monooxygenase [Apiospora arundinis]